jgi:hypothetical protein
MDSLSATPHNNAVQHYYVRDNGHRERDVFYGYEIVDYRLLFDYGVRHGEGQWIAGVRGDRL